MNSLLSLIILAIFPSALLANTKSVEADLTGSYYNEIWKKSYNEEIDIYVDDEANTYIRAGETNPATGFIPNDNFKALKESLEKSLEWGVKTKKAKLETTKEIAELFTEYDGKTQGVKVVFMSVSGGQEMGIALIVKDFKTYSRECSLALDEKQVRALIDALEKVPSTFKDLKAETSKANAILN